MKHSLGEKKDTSELIVGVSTIKDGNMSVKWGDEKEVEGNRKKFLDKLGIKFEDCMLASLLGGTHIEIVKNSDKGKYVEGDAFITKEKNLGLFMVTADCFPVLIFDPLTELLGLVHLGYKGVDGKLVEDVIQKMINMGSDINELKVWIGPGIRKESYVWDEEEIHQKESADWKPFLKSENGKINVDLPGYIKSQIINSGVKSDNISDSEIDTGKNENYFSHYRSKRTEKPEGRFATVAMVKKL